MEKPYGYLRNDGYYGRIDEETDDWQLFPTEEEYLEFIELNNKCVEWYKNWNDDLQKVI